MIAGLLNLIVYCLVIGLVIWLIHYLVDVIPVPHPFNRVIKVATLVIAVLLVILLLLSLVDSGPVRFPRL